MGSEQCLYSEMKAAIETLLRDQHKLLAAHVTEQFSALRREINLVQGVQTADAAKKTLQGMTSKLDGVHRQQQEMMHLLGANRHLQLPVERQGRAVISLEAASKGDLGLQDHDAEAERPDVRGRSGSPAPRPNIDLDYCMERLQKLQEEQRRELHMAEHSEGFALSSASGRRSSASRRSSAASSSIVQPSLIMQLRKARLSSGESSRTPRASRLSGASSLGSVDESERKKATRKDLKSLQSMDIMKQVMAMKKLVKTGRTGKMEASWAEKAVHAVEAIAAFLIVANVIWMAVEVELSMRAVVQGGEPPEAYYWVDACFAFAFGVELLIKIAYYRSGFFFGPCRWWNLLDAFLVAFSIFDLALSTVKLTFFRVLRSIRAIRAGRIISTAKVIPQLRLMVASIMCSASALFWACVLLLMILFLFAMALQQSLGSVLQSEGPDKQHPMLMEFYGSLPRTMVSLFMAISGGVDWRTLAGPLENISPVYLGFFVIFVMVATFGLLNVLTAVFVEATANVVAVDEDLVIQESLENEAKAVAQLMALLEEAAVDETGTILLSEFERKLADPRFRTQMKLMDLDICQACDIFRLVDEAGTDEVDITDLVFGMLRLRGNARAMDMATLLHNNKRIGTRLAAFMERTEGNFSKLKTSIRSLGVSSQDLGGDVGSVLEEPHCAAGPRPVLSRASTSHFSAAGADIDGVGQC